MRPMHRILATALAGAFLGASASFAADSAPSSGLVSTGEPLVEALIPVILSPSAPPIPTNRFRVATYNLENFSDGFKDGEGRTPEKARNQAADAAKILGKINPDLLMLEEIENSTSLGLLNDAMAAPFSFGYVTRFGTRTGRTTEHNIAVLSRLRLENVREVDFGPMRGAGTPPRGFLSFEVDLGGQRRLMVFAVHLKSNYGEAAKNRFQRQKALEFVRARADEIRKERPDVQWETLLVGDFNVDPTQDQFKDDPTLKAVSDWLDLWAGRPAEERDTCPNRKGDPTRDFPPATFDRMFVSKELTSTPWKVSPLTRLKEGVDTNDMNTLPGTGKGHVSDHYPVFTDLIP